MRHHRHLLHLRTTATNIISTVTYHHGYHHRRLGCPLRHTPPLLHTTTFTIATTTTLTDATVISIIIATTVAMAAVVRAVTIFAADSSLLSSSL
ncbi:hypothetical protein Tco_0507072 [Tanacetum coccineum]